MFVQVNENNGACHARPPQPTLLIGPPGPLSGGQPQFTVRSMWPPVELTDWCGEHPMFTASGSALIDRRLAAEVEGRG